jgi:acetyl-CoA carboxylase biotin carboxyl carrier protein
MDIKDLEQIFDLLKQNDITDFELNREGFQLKLSRAKPELRVVGLASGGNSSVEPAIYHNQPIATTSFYPQHQGGSAAGESSAAVENYFKVESPLVGTFYKRPSPDASNFVEEGTVVKKGQKLCIVEAMKLMNEIESPIAGTIVKILSSDGEVVEFGEVLFLIDPA